MSETAWRVVDPPCRTVLTDGGQTVFGWLTRRRKPETESQSTLASNAGVYAHLRGKLDDMNMERQRQEDADRVVQAFGDTLSKHDEMILDARFLIHPKPEIYAAFDTRIAFIERLCDETAEKQWQDRLEQYSTLRRRISDFQTIDTEDEAAVAEANSKQMEERRAALLFLKYHQRAMKENEIPVENPCEQGEERTPFSELARRMLDA